MKTLDLDTLIIEYSHSGVTGVRLPSDRPGDSSLHPVIEEVLMNSPELDQLVWESEDCGDPQELDFEAD